MNLAVTLAQLGDRTLLIDSDLRKPGIRRALELTTGKGRRAEFVPRRCFDTGRSYDSPSDRSRIWSR